MPLLLGWHPTSVVTGSMEPRLLVGDLAVSRPVPPAALRVNQVILYPDPDHPGRLRLHRFVAVNPEGLLVTRGDANPQDDSTPVDPTTVLGVGTLRIPYVAGPRVWWQEGRWVLLAVTAVVLAGALALTRLDHDLQRRAEDDDDVDGDDPADDDPPDDDPADDDPPDDDPADDDPPDDVGGERPAVSGEPPADAQLVPDRGRRLVLVRWVLPVAAAVLSTVGIVSPASYSAFTDTTSAGRSVLSAAPYYTCAAAVADDAPRTWFRFDETSGTTAADSSGSGRTGTYRGGYTLGVTRACGKDTGAAVTLNGSTGYVSTASQLAIPSTLTFEARVRTTTTRGGLLVGFANVATGASTAVDRQLYLTNAGKISFGLRVNNANTVVTSPGSYADGQWHHVVATLSGASLVLYVDGQQVDADTAGASAAGFTGYGRVGYDTLRNWSDAPTSNYLAATLDDVAIYNTVLSAADVRAHHAAGV